MRIQVLCCSVRSFYYWANHLYGDAFEWFTLNSLSSGTLKSLAFSPLSWLCVLIDKRNDFSFSPCSVSGPPLGPQGPRHSSSAAHRYLCCGRPWSCRRGQLRSCSCQRSGDRISWGCRDSVPSIFTHSCRSQRWPPAQWGQQPNPGSIPGRSWAGEVHGHQGILLRELCFQP